jgi:hypothetical protein
VAAAVALLTWLAFLAYAFLSPATYRATAQVALESSSGTEITTKGPLEAARRLQEAVLDRDLLQKLAAEQAPDASSEVHIQIARAIRAAFQIDSLDSRTFTVSYKDQDGFRAASRCNALAERAVVRGPLAFAQESGAEQRTRETEWRRAVDRLVAFFAAHPELVNEAPAAGAAPSPSFVDTARELRAERARIEAQLSARASPARSDNPYGEAAQPHEGPRSC